MKKKEVKPNIYSKIEKETKKNKMIHARKVSLKKIRRKIRRTVRKIAPRKINKVQKEIVQKKVIPQKKVVQGKPQKVIPRKVPRERTKINVKLLVSSFLLIFLIAVLGSFFTQSNVNSMWYDAIKPNLTPPSFVFGIVWSVLFFLIALSLYLCLNKKNGNKLILILFSINLFLNVLWSFLFFYMQNPLFAFFDLIAMWILIILMIFFTYKTNKLASYLLVPYFLWVSFAGALNYLSAFMVTLV